MKNISIIIPFYNEEETVSDVLTEVLQACPDAEVIAVDDGSTDQTAPKIKTFNNVTYLPLPQNLGQSAALYAGLRHANRDICVMMDGDGQNDPADIPQLIEQMKPRRLVCGYRKERRDSWQKRVASRIANHIRKSILDDGVRDTGCTLKAMTREDVRFLVPFNGLHRFLPALLKNAGLEIIEVPVGHRPRLRGTSKYTVAGRAKRGIYDLIGVSWLLTRHIKWPLMSSDKED